ncbi:hypothetical protein niasHT_040078 [Heterodera trifolii]|uniref:J domain-containing protein n=1 Tax=Heterodera trifolii TaxID=157864 RepID=A0ABD2J3P6_9BILA
MIPLLKLKKKEKKNDKNLRPHELLCVRQNATPEEINENYRKIVRVIHPDKNNQCSDKLFMLITNAKDELLGRPGSNSMAQEEDNDQHMDMDMDIVKFAPFSEVLKTHKCVELVEVLGSFPKNAAESAAHGPLGQSDFSLLNYAFKIADENYALGHMMLAYKKALESHFVCKKCKKQMHLDGICYCNKAKTNCHCNARKCCDMKPEEFGRLN